MRTLKNFEKKTRGTPDFPCALYQVDSSYPDYCMPLHWHAEYEIILIRNGRMDITVDETAYTACEGDVLFLSDGMLHGGTPDGDGCVYDCVVFAGELLTKNTALGAVKDIFRHGRSVTTFISGNKYPEFSMTVRRLCDLLSAQAENKASVPDEYAGVMALGIMLELLGLLIRDGLCTDGYSETNRHIQKLKKALSYMEEHYPEKITLSQLAAEAGVTPKYLCRALCSLTGKTPIQYLNEYRIDCACEMLRSSSTGTDKTLLDIAVSCGFADQSYFVKWFRRLKGTTPKCYRNGPRQK